MNRKRSMMFAGAALTATLAVAVFAQAAPHRHEGRMPMPTTRAELQARIAEQFKLADTNGDGVVTRAEFDARTAAIKAKFEAKRAEHRAAEFAVLDTNHDGSLSKAEFLTPPHGEGWRHGPGGPDAPPPGAGPDGGGPDGPHGPRGHGWHGGGGHMRGLGMMGGKWFDKADTNHDGKLTLAEASAWPLAMFDRIDTNHDGTISPEEHEAARAAFRDRWKGKRD